tara:strand:- start:1524 stop:1793 length:270 start_codon:yes stop_codon:yes gene_type:complete
MVQRVLRGKIDDMKRAHEAQCCSLVDILREQQLDLTRFLTLMSNAKFSDGAAGRYVADWHDRMPGKIETARKRVNAILNPRLNVARSAK